MATKTDKTIITTSDLANRIAQKHQAVAHEEDLEERGHANNLQHQRTELQALLDLVEEEQLTGNN
ncbi:hypothetical protein GCM10027275_30780 [Rhabdobacter roseus]|uniref:Uncharacterized protein n=1 Tax=Rhabdobacter roseus TaxID=1655419 RepID=A0A840TTP0_9BACT|nr:hypothetical protein [Rhabdobacter roseus]MBB5285037.1 hypothetical protein [Rhabdobacter roseus]